MQEHGGPVDHDKITKMMRRRRRIVNCDGYGDIVSMRRMIVICDAVDEEDDEDDCDAEPDGNDEGDDL